MDLLSIEKSYKPHPGIEAEPTIASLLEVPVNEKGIKRDKVRPFSIAPREIIEKNEITTYRLAVYRQNREAEQEMLGQMEIIAPPNHNVEVEQCPQNSLFSPPLEDLVPISKKIKIPYPTKEMVLILKTNKNGILVLLNAEKEVANLICGKKKKKSPDDFFINGSQDHPWNIKIELGNSNSFPKINGQSTKK